MQEKPAAIEIGEQQARIAAICREFKKGSARTMQSERFSIRFYSKRKSCYTKNNRIQIHLLPGSYHTTRNNDILITPHGTAIERTHLADNTSWFECIHFPDDISH